MRTGTSAIAAAAAVAFLFACSGKKSSSEGEAPPSDPAIPVVSEAHSYAAEMATVDQGLASFRATAAKQPKSWLWMGRVATELIRRAQLTGDYQNYAEAQKLLDSAFAVAPKGSGPLLTRAGLNFSLHRVAAVEPDLAQAEKSVNVQKPTKARIMGLRADVHLHSGRYSEALQGYQAADDMRPTHKSAFRLARYYWLTGNYESAERWLDKAESRLPGKAPHLRAWTHLQRGIMDLDRNRLDDAMGHYRDGDALFSGWWLIEEHVAEIDTLQGRIEKAEKSYRDLIERTGDPEFMSALGDLLVGRAEGDAKAAAALKAEAEEWDNKARAAHLARLELLPEASWGHAVGYFLGSDKPGDAAKALELATANHDTRPSSEAKVWLAQAHAKNGQLDRAMPLVEEVLKSRYRTAELHATAALLLRASGQGARADEEQKRAAAIHPASMAELDWLSAALTATPAGSAPRPDK